MGASRDKKMRRIAEMTETAPSKKKEEKTSGYNKKAVIIAAVVAVVAIVVLVFNSSLLYRYGTAVTVGGEDYSAAEFNYFYSSAYNNIYQQYYQIFGDSARQYMPDTTRPLSEQYEDESTGTTWASYLESMTLLRMNTVTMLCKNAEEEGFKLSDRAASQIEESFKTLPDAARSIGLRSVKGYLEYVYGKGMNEKILRKCTRMEALAMEYSTYRAEQYQFSDEELDTYYDENLANDYDFVNFRRFFFSTTPADGEDAETAKANARARAIEFQSRVTDEQSFVDLAYEYAADDVKATYEDPDATLMGGYGTSLNSAYYHDWLLDNQRATGDCAVLPDPDEETSMDGFYVVYFIDRDVNDYPSVNYTYMYIPVGSVSRDAYADDEAYYKAAADATAGAVSLANEISESWSADPSDENYDALLSRYADSIGDSDTVKRDGKYDMSDNVISWLFDPGRKAGDVTVLDSQYGNAYYVMRFDGTDIYRSRALAKNEMGSQAFSDWQEEVSADYKSTLKGLMRFTKKIPALGG